MLKNYISSYSLATIIYCFVFNPPVAQCSGNSEKSELKLRWQTNGCQGMCPVTEKYNPLKMLRHVDCDKFCKCNWGSSVIIKCPEGLLFNFEARACDWPENVECLAYSSEYTWDSWGYDEYEDDQDDKEDNLETVWWVAPYSEPIQLFF